jgi:DNA mismatch repair protein MutS2
LPKVLAMLAAKTAFSAGRELAESLAPSADPSIVERRQRLTGESRWLASAKPGLNLGGARDVRAFVGRAELGGLLQPLELLDIASTIRVSRLWRGTLDRLSDQVPVLAQLGQRLGDHRPIKEEIDRCITDGGEVADDASPELRGIRLGLRSARERLTQRLQQLVGGGMREVLTEPVLTQRNGRYVIPVRAEFRGRVKGIVHDQSASGATVFVEPLEIVEAGNRIRQLEVEEQHEVERILGALSALVASDPAIALTVEVLAEIDLHTAAATLAEEMSATPPTVAAHEAGRRTPVLRLDRARHPLLRGDVVPLTLELGGEFDVLVITGPNTGGKTVALKTVGLLSMMAQCGLQVPADDGSTIPLFSGIFADIGDEQSIEQSLSTFSSHVTHIIDILDQADGASLVLLDEVGAGTDPQEGSALAQAILHDLVSRGVKTIATTHYPELKSFAQTVPRIQNASVEFDVETLRPTYRLSVGVPGQSNALTIASRLGMSDELVASARGYLDPSHTRSEALFADLQRQQKEAANLVTEANERMLRAERLRQRAREELRRAEREHRAIVRDARDQSRQMLDTLRREAEEKLHSIVAGGAQRQELRRAAAELRALQPIPEPPPPKTSLEPEPELEEIALVKPGMEILVPSIGVPSRVISVSTNGDAELDVRGMRVRVRASELQAARRASRDDRREAERRVTRPMLERVADAPSAPPTQLDLRGMRVDEVHEALDRYLNDAYLGGMRMVRVVHGKGTGAVRAAVREQLARHALVSRFSSADARQGGEGATEVVLAG